MIVSISIGLIILFIGVVAIISYQTAHALTDRVRAIGIRVTALEDTITKWRAQLG